MTTDKTLARSEIRPQQTYKLYTGSLVYVQDIQGQKVICNRVGDVDRKTISLGRFAAMCVSEEPNQ